MMKRFHRELIIWRWTQLTWINSFPGKDLGSPEFRWQSLITGGVRGPGGLEFRSSGPTGTMGYLVPSPEALHPLHLSKDLVATIIKSKIKQTSPLSLSMTSILCVTRLIYFSFSFVYSKNLTFLTHFCILWCHTSQGLWKYSHHKDVSHLSYYCVAIHGIIF